jgi:hypothetical protein
MPLVVSVTRSSGPLPAGSYTIVAYSGGPLDTCEIAIPDSGAASSTCQVAFFTVMDPESLTVRLPLADSVEIVVSADSGVVDTTLIPIIEVTYPNGRDCGGCPQGFASLELP